MFAVAGHRADLADLHSPFVQISLNIPSSCPQPTKQQSILMQNRPMLEHFNTDGLLQWSISF